MNIQDIFNTTHKKSEFSKIVWGEFKRKEQNWHFGPYDEKRVVFDGQKSKTLYRYTDTDDMKTTVKSNTDCLRLQYEIELMVDSSDCRWREPISEKKMYAVAIGMKSHNKVQYYRPIIILDKQEFKQLKKHYLVSNKEPLKIGRKNGSEVL